jgi:hypothetical protein
MEAAKAREYSVNLKRIFDKHYQLVKFPAHNTKEQCIVEGHAGACVDQQGYRTMVLERESGTIRGDYRKVK